MHKNTIRIGTRKSPLAMAQAQQVQALLQSVSPEMVVELVPMVTTGDVRTDRTLADIGGKGLFTKELEEALLSGAVDMAVHSMKDMETRIKEEFIIAAVLPRADARDALVMQGAGTLATLKQGARVGTSSLRRTAILKILRPDITVVPLRGTVNTRLDKLARGEMDATILAVAGLDRLGLAQVITERLNINEFIPAVAQGIIAIEARRNDAALLKLLSTLNHEPTWIAGVAERSLLARLDGSCRTPIAAHATLQGDSITLTALVAKPDGTQHVKASQTAHKAEAEQLGRGLAEELLAKGGAACLT